MTKFWGPTALGFLLEHNLITGSYTIFFNTNYLFLVGVKEEHK
jgi:hypothetical protein